MSDVTQTATAVPDTLMAVDFLLRVFGDDVIFVVAIDNGGLGAAGGRFTKTQIEGLTKWINNFQGKRNLYFFLNPLIDSSKPKSKAAKEDIRGAKWLHADIDPRAGESIESEKKRAMGLLTNMKQPPTVIIDSGNGLQPLWKLKDEYPVNGDPDKIKYVEARNRKFEYDFSGDHCFNIDRVLRIPGTINVPGAAKLKKGRVPVTASLVLFDAKRVYDIESFEELNVATKTADGATPLPQLTIPDSVELDSVLGLTAEMKYIAVHGTHPDNPSRWHSRSEMYFWWIINAYQAKVSQEDIASILLDGRYAISDGVREKRNAKEYVVRQITRALQKSGAVGKPQIVMLPDNLEDMLNKAEAAINDAGIELFQSHGNLVRLIDRGESDPPAITDVKSRWLLEKFISSARWVKQGRNGFTTVEPKVAIAEHYIEREGEWRVPHLNGIVMTPTLRKDFTLISEPGYDKRSGLFFVPGKTKFDKIPERPTREDAEAALAKLVQPFRMFPFVPDDAPEDWAPGEEEGLFSSSARSVVLSAMITGIIRVSLPTSPMHAIDAPEKGTGKGMIADCVAILVTGYNAVMVSLGNDETEDRKRLFSILSQGARVVVIDNIERSVSGDALCTILTQETWQDRVLGKSEMKPVSTNALFMATGNNLRFVGDMTRRAIVTRMDARSERPDERKFNFDPRQMVREQRAELVSACLTIILAYVAAGRTCTDMVKPMGSFEGWSIVREALVWLGEPDPALSRNRVRSDDSARIIVSEMMELWKLVYSNSEIKLLSVFSGLTNEVDGDHHKMALRDLCTSVCRGGRLNLQDLTRWFQKNSGKIVGDQRFLRVEDPKLGTVVRLEMGVQEEVDPAAVINF